MPYVAEPAAAPSRPSILTPVDFVPLGDGTFRAIPRKPVELAGVAVAAKMTGAKRDAIYKLYETGFIRGTQVSPRKLLINVASLLEHMENAADPEFWTKERHLRYFGTLSRVSRRAIA